MATWEEMLIAARIPEEQLCGQDPSRLSWVRWTLAEDLDGAQVGGALAQCLFPTDHKKVEKAARAAGLNLPAGAQLGLECLYLLPSSGPGELVQYVWVWIVLRAESNPLRVYAVDGFEPFPHKLEV